MLRRIKRFEFLTDSPLPPRFSHHGAEQKIELVSSTNISKSIDAPRFMHEVVCSAPLAMAVECPVPFPVTSHDEDELMRGDLYPDTTFNISDGIISAPECRCRFNKESGRDSVQHGTAMMRADGTIELQEDLGILKAGHLVCYGDSGKLVPYTGQIDQAPTKALSTEEAKVENNSAKPVRKGKWEFLGAPL